MVEKFASLETLLVSNVVQATIIDMAKLLNNESTLFLPHELFDFLLLFTFTQVKIPISTFYVSIF